MTDKNTRIQIRASSLGGFAACPRHAVANRERDTLALAHPDVKPRKGGGYKPVVGTAFHYCMEKDLKEPKEIIEGVHPILKNALDASEMEDFYDGRFFKLEQLENIVRGMVDAFRKSGFSKPWVEDREDNSFEVEVESLDIDPGVRVTGHIDLVTKDGQVVDLKTGQVTDANLYYEQLTMYRLLLQMRGDDVRPDASIVKVARPLSPKSDLSKIRIAEFHVDTRPHAARVIKLVKNFAEIMDQRDKWKDDFTRIPCNPASKACQYCELRASTACPETAFVNLADGNTVDG